MLRRRLLELLKAILLRQTEVAFKLTASYANMLLKGVKFPLPAKMDTWKADKVKENFSVEFIASLHQISDQKVSAE